MDHCTKLYVELTSTCNLHCTMCVRGAWRELPGSMPAAAFRALIEELRDFSPAPIIHLGGYGEPTYHPDFLELVRLAKAANLRVEVTTNAMLLDRPMAIALVELGLDRLVVSVDGLTPASYAAIRPEGVFAQVVENLRDLYRIKLRKATRHSNPQVGLAFVAMRQNVADLPHLPALAAAVGASSIQVSNVIPHTAEMEGQILYGHALTACAYRSSVWVPTMSLPKLDLDGATLEPLRQVFTSTASISLLDGSLSARNDYCRFAQESYAAVRWDGELSPCLELLHAHPVFVRGRRKEVAHHSFGNIGQSSFRALWESAAFAAHRGQLRRFPFSPCTTCGGCERFAGNSMDCTENTFPTCGGCLWAQGFVQCP
ncbi:MAG: radical SAM protein [Chloroflexi bacterium]|nr:radical SAM protein [Chloroflexota bacterium]